LVKNLTLVARYQGPLWWHGKIGKPEAAYWEPKSESRKQEPGWPATDGNSVSRLASMNGNNASMSTRRRVLEVKTGLKVLVVRPRFPSSCSGMVNSTTCNAQVSAGWWGRERGLGAEAGGVLWGMRCPNVAHNWERVIDLFT
jgi:hypothetical protein